MKTSRRLSNCTEWFIIWTKESHIWRLFAGCQLQPGVTSVKMVHITAHGNKSHGKISGLESQEGLACMWVCCPLRIQTSVNSYTPWTKWPPFRRRYFKYICWMTSFVFWLRFYWGLVCGSSWRQPSIGLDNGLAPNGGQAIIWTNAVLIPWRIYAALGEMN